jgi:hypothetical protein
LGQPNFPTNFYKSPDFFPVSQPFLQHNNSTALLRHHRSSINKMSSNQKDLATYVLEDFAKLPGLVLTNNIIPRLEKVNISHIRVPQWSQYNLSSMIFQLGYKSFVKTVDSVNYFAIDRWEMEALWWDIIKKKYALYDPRPSDYGRLRTENFAMCMKDKEEILYKGFHSVSHFSPLCNSSADMK